MDGSFSNNDDLNSELGDFIFLSDVNNNSKAIYFQSFKIKRVVRSVLGRNSALLRMSFIRSSKYSRF